MQGHEQLQTAYAKAEQESELWCRLAGRAVDSLDAIAGWEVSADDEDAAGQMAEYADKAAADIRAAYAMHYRGAVRPAEVMPAPETAIQLHNGQIMPAMFFYTIEGHDMSAIASEHGFEISFIDFFESCVSDEAHDAAEAAYIVDADKVLAEWQPWVREGWQFGGKWHSEEGPVACFLRKKESAQ